MSQVWHRVARVRLMRDRVIWVRNKMRRSGMMFHGDGGEGVVKDHVFFLLI